MAEAEMRMAGVTKFDKKGKRVLRSKDIAHILDISPDDVIELARKKVIPASKNGRFWIFSIAQISKIKKGYADYLAVKNA
jgi:hypothetical protein